MSTRGREEGRGDGRKRAQPRHIWVHPVCFSFVPRERTRGGRERESHPPPPPPTVARSDNVDKNKWHSSGPAPGAGMQRGCGVAWQGNVGVAWQGNRVVPSSIFPSEIILFVHFNVESARFGSVRPTRFRHGEGGPRTRHARTFTSTSTSTSTPHPHPTPRFKTLSPLPFFGERERGLQALLPPLSSPPSQAPPPAFGQMCAAACGLLGGGVRCGGWFAGAADGRTGRRTDAGPTPAPALPPIDPYYERVS